MEWRLCRLPFSLHLRMLLVSIVSASSLLVTSPFFNCSDVELSPIYSFYMLIVMEALILCWRVVGCDSGKRILSHRGSGFRMTGARRVAMSQFRIICARALCVQLRGLPTS
jgi:hypothetical protein